MRRILLHPYSALALAALGALLVYGRTLHPGLPAGDSGELITVAYELGVAHPPGYPLYTMLGHLWIAWFSFLTPALALNVFSAVSHAVALFALGIAAYRLTRSVPAALAAMVSLAVAGPFWKYAVVAEVFALNTAMAALLLAVIAVAATDERARPRSAIVAAFLLALAISHHHTFALLGLPALVALIAITLRAPASFDTFDRRRWMFLLAGSGIAGLLPLLYLPLAAGTDPYLNWGNPRQWRGMLELLLRMDYGTFRLDAHASGHEADLPYGRIFSGELVSTFGVHGLAAAALGLMVCLRRIQLLASTMLGFAVLQFLFFSRVGFPSDPLYRGVVERFYILPLLAVALLLGIGTGSALSRLSRRPRLLVATLWVLALAVPMGTRYHAMNQRGNRFTEEFSRAVLASVPQNGVLFSRGDLVHNGVAYLQQVLEERSDVTVIDQELMTRDWYIRAWRKRDPLLLPPMPRATRITLDDGSSYVGAVRNREDSVLTLVSQKAVVTIPLQRIASREEDLDPASVYDTGVGDDVGADRGKPVSTFRSTALDRYSGLPGTNNVFWIDHLRPGRPVAFVGTREPSYAIAYSLVHRGLVQVAIENQDQVDLGGQVDETLDILTRFDAAAALRPFDPTSFEAQYRGQILDLLARAATLLCQPEAYDRQPDTSAGFRRLLTILDHNRDLGNGAHSGLLRAGGLLAVYHPAVRDSARARRDLERYLEIAPEGPERVEAKTALDQVSPTP